MKNITFWICILIWAFITLVRVIFHQPWFDESNAWEIARNMHFGNMFESVKYEGHFFVWYLLLMPFAKLNFGYPYSMTLLNWGFCFASILVLWQFAPFNNLTKALITFSFPFLACYPVVARCYSIGILPIFLLCVLYKNRLKYPIIYSLLVVFAMNTSIIAFLCSFLFGVFLLLDLFKQENKKDFKICLSIAGITFLTTLIQILNFSTDKLPVAKAFGFNLPTMLSTFVLLNPLINAILLVIFAVGFCVCLFKDKRMFAYVILVFVSILTLFKVTYSGDFWHYYFLYVSLISACWVAFDENKINENCKNALTCLLCFLSFLLIFDFRNEISVYHSNSKEVANYVKEHKNDCSIFLNQIFFMTLPYLRDGKTDYDIKIIDNSNGSYNIGLDFESIMYNLEPNKNNYIYINSCAEIPNLIKGEKVMKFELDKNIKNLYCIYKVNLEK